MQLGACMCTDYNIPVLMFQHDVIFSLHALTDVNSNNIATTAVVAFLLSSIIHTIVLLAVCWTCHSRKKLVIHRMYLQVYKILYHFIAAIRLTQRILRTFMR